MQRLWASLLFEAFVYIDVYTEVLIKGLLTLRVSTRCLYDSKHAVESDM